MHPVMYRSTDLCACRVACARYGGPIAMVRDDRKLVVVTGGMTKPVVKIYTAAGAPLAAFMWDHGRVAAMRCTSEEDLLIVEDSGEVGLHAHVPLHALLKMTIAHTHSSSIPVMRRCRGRLRLHAVPLVIS